MSDSVDLGIDVSDVWHGPPFPLEARATRPRPRADQLRVVLLLQRSRRQSVARSGSHRPPARPDRHHGNGFTSVADLEGALRRAEAAHVEHQKRQGRSHLFHRSSQDEDWPAWYAAYMEAEQDGGDLPS